MGKDYVFWTSCHLNVLHILQVCSTCLLLQKRSRIEVKEECRHAKDTSSIILSESTDSKLGIRQIW